MGAYGLYSDPVRNTKAVRYQRSHKDSRDVVQSCTVCVRRTGATGPWAHSRFFKVLGAVRLRLFCTRHHVMISVKSAEVVKYVMPPSSALSEGVHFVGCSE